MTEGPIIGIYSLLELDKRLSFAAALENARKLADTGGSLLFTGKNLKDPQAIFFGRQMFPFIPDLTSQPPDPKNKGYELWVLSTYKQSDQPLLINPAEQLLQALINPKRSVEDLEVDLRGIYSVNRDFAFHKNDVLAWRVGAGLRIAIRTDELQVSTSV